MLSIIIPHHKESIDDMSYLLSTLDLQIGVNYNDLEILVCNDSPENVIADFVRYEHIAPVIRNVSCPVRDNPGLNRQAGLDAARGEYVMFCDADDALQSLTTLQDILTLMKSGADVYTFSFIEECEFEGKRMIKVTAVNKTWIFAKVIRLDFLRGNNIRFTPELLYQEDTYFNRILYAYRPKTEICNFPIYVWRYNAASITRKDRCEYSQGGLPEYIEATDKAFEYILSRNLQNLTPEFFHSVCYIYNKLQDPDPRIEKYRDRIETGIAAFIKKYDADGFRFTPQGLHIASQAVYGTNTFQWLPKESYIGWLTRISAEKTIPDANPLAKAAV